jgi:hypothetical protein
MRVTDEYTPTEGDWVTCEYGSSWHIPHPWTLICVNPKWVAGYGHPQDRKEKDNLDSIYNDSDNRLRWKHDGALVSACERCGVQWFDDLEAQ